LPGVAEVVHHQHPLLPIGDDKGEDWAAAQERLESAPAEGGGSVARLDQPAVAGEQRPGVAGLHSDVGGLAAGREVVPEFIQGRVNVRNLVRAAENLMIEPLRTETRDALLALRARLGEPGAAARVAAIALEMML